MKMTSIKITAESPTLPIEHWEGFDAMKRNILDTACDNGIAEKDDCAYYIYPDSVYNLDSIERKIVGLPDEYPYDMYIRNRGNLSRSNMEYLIEFYTYSDGGEQIPAQIDGPVIHTPDRDYILTKEQYALSEAISEFNSLTTEEKTEGNNYRSFSKIKKLSNEAAATLDRYFANTTVVTPEHIKIHITNDNGNAHLDTLINDVDNEQFSERTCFDDVPDVITLRGIDNPRERVRIPLTEEQRKTIIATNKVNERIRKGEKYENVIKDYVENLDDGTVDISEIYSDRVVEIGIYKPTFYTFVCPYKSQWLPGIKIEDKVNGDSYLFFGSDEELEAFKQATHKAIENGNKEVTWKGKTISTEVALESIATANKIREGKLTDEDIENYSANSDENARNNYVDNRPESEVLIIQENAETLGYSEINSVEDSIDELVFTPITNISEGIMLKDHQKEGVAWLQYLFSNKYKGCLLADDMGLGKTLQLLYFIQWHKNNLNPSSKPYLIVAPVSLLENWYNEYNKFFQDPKLKVRIVQSSEIGQKYNKEKVDALQGLDLILTNYETVRRCQFNFCAVNFAVVVLDEAQRAKTPGTLVTQSVKALKADFKIAATGTPVENTLMDLWCIMDFSIPGLLGAAKDFARIYQNPIKDGDTDIVALGLELREELGIFFKRRLKSDVAKDLPSKKIVVKESQMTPLQLQLYLDQICYAQQIKESGSVVPGFMFTLIHNFRQITDGTFMLGSDFINQSPESLLDKSSKLGCTLNILKDIKARNEKVIIFTDFKETQKMLQFLIKCEFGITCKIVNGDTPTVYRLNSTKESRQKAIDRFQETEGFNIIIMSPLATGMGLNVTGANNVIHYSRFWNPAKEEQATDRVYRIGQTKDVNVYYPMSVTHEFPTFDVTIDKLLKTKMSLAKATLFPTDRAEIKQADLFNSLLDVKNISENNQVAVKIEDVDNLDPAEFDALIAAIYHKKGYTVILNSRTNNKGVNIIACGMNENLLIQTQHNFINDSLDSIKTCVPFFQSKYNLNFTPFIVSNAETGNECNYINSRGKLKEMLDVTKITYVDILKEERKRLS